MAEGDSVSPASVVADVATVVSFEGVIVSICRDEVVTAGVEAMDEGQRRPTKFPVNACPNTVSGVLLTPSHAAAMFSSTL